MNNSPRGRGATKAQPAPHLAPLTLNDLRSYREELREENERISYWRRLVTARRTSLAHRTLEALTPTEVHRALGATASGARRERLLRANPTQALPPLPGARGAWTRAATATTTATATAATATPAAEVIEQDLAAALAMLTDYQQALRLHLAQATTELITRYAADPTAALHLIDAR